MYRRGYDISRNPIVLVGIKIKILNLNIASIKGMVATPDSEFGLVLNRAVL